MHGMSAGAHSGQKIGNGGPLEIGVTATMSAARTEVLLTLSHLSTPNSREHFGCHSSVCRTAIG